MQRQLAPGNQRWLTPWEAVPLLVVAALIGFQLFVPPVIGMADNGDFAKVAARVCMQPPPDLLHSPERYWHYFLTTYEVAPQHCLAFWPWSSMVPIVGRPSSFMTWWAKRRTSTCERSGPCARPCGWRAFGGCCAF